ncbi:AraC family transcriptional regulator [Marinobacter sp. SS21]|uniref:AraC family transcriptional regulator n=1 Tax=Marinobacter sp. SS21 TaxID=2979460 RepID=UPI00232CF1BC|nr:AraC family transcriptional regulator [Marinobacter sp. SS21]MDC0661366.1 AraC family transcriptional regulator ligand-binding domain-containing protein [Marinobacter sp. SS21]
MKAFAGFDRPSVPASYLQLLVEVVSERGHNQTELLAGLPIEPSVLEETNARISPMQWGLAVSRAMSLCDDKGLGYECGLSMRPTVNGFLGYAIMSCGSMRKAMELTARYFESRQRNFAMSMSIKGAYAEVEVREKHEIPALREFFYEHILIGITRGVATILGKPLSDLDVTVCFDWREPAYYDAYRERLPTTLFSQSANLLRFPATLLDLQPVLADPQASKQAIELCERELAQLGSAGDSMGLRVCAQLVQAPEGGYPDLESIASRIHMTTRTIARKLSDEGTSFQLLLDETRRRDACAMIEEGTLQLQDIATRLGYLNPANFTRAFRRWTGKTPSEWRDGRE